MADDRPDPADLRARAEWVLGQLPSAAGRPDAHVVELRSPVGGGSLPGQTLPSFGVAVPVRSATRAAAALRKGEPRILARVEGGELTFDLRTVGRFDDGDLVRAIGGLIAADR